MTKRISELDASAAANLTDQGEVNQSGTSRRQTLAQEKTLFGIDEKTFKNSVRIATEVNDSLSGLAARDGVTPVAGDRILVKAQSTASANGIYDAASGAWTRSTDFDTDAKATSSAFIAVQEGTVNADKLFQLTTNEPITLGTTALVFTEFVGGGGGGTIIDSIPCVLEVPEGTIAFPDIHALVTQDSKVSGFVLPDGATLSEINFKCKVPDALNASPAAKIRVTIMTLGASSGDLRLQVSTKAAADTENIDLAFDLETEATVPMPTAIETMDVYEQTLTNQPSAGDFYTGQLKRDPVDSLDTYANDVLIVAIELIITRDT